MNTVSPSIASKTDTDSPLSGLHILASLKCDPEVLTEFDGIKIFFEDLIAKYSLQSVGQCYHKFDGGGYTAVICLTESHLSIHTWPELQYATFDIFLSNYLKDNTQTVHQFYRDVVKYLNAEVIREQFINR